MQVTALQAAEMYGVSTHRIKHTLFAYYKGRADNNSPVRLPCPIVITCQRHLLYLSASHSSIVKTCIDTKQVCMLPTCNCCKQMSSTDIET